MKCTKCHIEKQEVDFYIHSNGKPRKQCKCCILENNRKNFNPVQALQYAKNYRDANYELCLERTRKWIKNHPQYNSYRQQLYHTRKTNQTPKWADLDKIKDIYLNCPKGFHVDHIVPLKGKTVSGLHTHNNLQYLTQRENCSKGNRYAKLL